MHLIVILEPLSRWHFCSRAHLLQTDCTTCPCSEVIGMPPQGRKLRDFLGFIESPNTSDPGSSVRSGQFCTRNRTKRGVSCCDKAPLGFVSRTLLLQLSPEHSCRREQRSATVTKNVWSQLHALGGADPTITTAL
eukprot:3024482-Amphidinium_carterae.1